MSSWLRQVHVLNFRRNHHRCLGYITVDTVAMDTITYGVIEPKRNRTITMVTIIVAADFSLAMLCSLNLRFTRRGMFSLAWSANHNLSR